MSNQPSRRAGPSCGPQAQPPSPESQKWEIGDVGFDTEKKLWFVQLTNEANQNVGTYMAKNIILKQGNAAQYEWKDFQGRPFWHVRERFFADQIESIGVDPSGMNVTLHFKEDQELPLGTPKEPQSGDVPVEFHHLHYAFHLSTKEIAVGNRAPFGFVEFYDITGNLVHVINNHWIVIEGIDRKTVGEFPKIRLRIERQDVARIITTATVVVIQGKKVGS